MKREPIHQILSPGPSTTPASWCGVQEIGQAWQDVNGVPVAVPRMDLLIACRDGNQWYGQLHVADVPGRWYGPYAREGIALGVCKRAARRVEKQATAP